MGKVFVAAILGGLIASSAAYAGDMYSCSFGHQQTVKNTVTVKPAETAATTTRSSDKAGKTLIKAQRAKETPEG